MPADDRERERAGVDPAAPGRLAVVGVRGDRVVEQRDVRQVGTCGVVARRRRRRRADPALQVRRVARVHAARWGMMTGYRRHACGVTDCTNVGVCERAVDRWAAGFLYGLYQNRLRRGLDGADAPAPRRDDHRRQPPLGQAARLRDRGPRPPRRRREDARVPGLVRRPRHLESSPSTCCPPTTSATVDRTSSHDADRDHRRPRRGALALPRLAGAARRLDRRPARAARRRARRRRGPHRRATRACTSTSPSATAGAREIADAMRSIVAEHHARAAAASRTSPSCSPPN